MLAISLSYNDNRTWRGIWIIFIYKYDLMFYSYYWCLVMRNMLIDNHAYCTTILMLDTGQHFFLYSPSLNLNLDL